MGRILKILKGDKMDKNQKQFLRYLYFKDFELRDREIKLTAIHDFPDENSNIRNDQSISEVRRTHIIIDDIITEFLKRF